VERSTSTPSPSTAIAVSPVRSRPGVAQGPVRAAGSTCGVLGRLAGRCGCRGKPA
jgi:hypothetical protein